MLPEAAWERMAETPKASLLHNRVSPKPRLPASLINARYVTVTINFLFIINIYVVVTEIAVEAEESDLVTGQRA